MKEITYNDDRDDKYKYKSWIFTWNADGDDVLVDKCTVEEILKTIAIEYVFQEEKVTRRHYQGYLKFGNRKSKLTALNLFISTAYSLLSCLDCFQTNKEYFLRNLTLKHVYGTDEEVISYVSKSDSRIGETIYSHNLLPYKTSDLAILSSRDCWYLWQSTLCDLIIEKARIITPDDRSIHWIRDYAGCSGKSKLVKYLVYKFPDEIIKLPFGSSNQLRSAVCMAGAKKVYFIDIPRTLSHEEDLDSVFSVIEDIKNGFVATCMYGKFQQVLFEPPHIVVFSNKACPTGKLSKDRWIEYSIIDLKLIKNDQWKH